MNARPLDRFPIIRTRDVDAMREALAICGANALAVRQGTRGFDGYGNSLELNSIRLNYIAFGTAVSQQLQQFTHYGQQFRLRGKSEATIGRTQIDLSPDKSLVYSPGTSPKYNFSADFEHCVLCIEPDALLNKLEALTGSKPRNDLKFEPIAHVNSPEAISLQRQFMFYVDQFGASDSAVPPLAVVELEQALITAFVSVNRHSESHLFDRLSQGVAPWQVTRAEEYIEANWDQPITVEALVVVTNASARSIFQSFRDSRGYSPMAFVKRIRLRHAQRMLTTLEEEEVSVTGVAFRCGFSNLGHFSKDYRAAFGELPSETLNRAKGASVSSMPGSRSFQPSLGMR
jgi:AraC-like DNA-binding protein